MIMKNFKVESVSSDLNLELDKLKSNAIDLSTSKEFAELIDNEEYKIALENLESIDVQKTNWKW